MKEFAIALFQSMVPIFVLVMMGLALRRLGAFGEKGNNRLSQGVIYFFFPVLVFHRLATTEDPSMLLADWMIHVWAVVILVGSGLIGWGWHRLMKSGADKRLFIFMVAMPNWIFLPLALAGPLWGDDAVRLIILFNIPTQIMLWTVGIWLLHGTLRDMHAMKYILINPGFLATIAGLLVAFEIIPVTLLPDKSGLSLASLTPILHIIGGLTIPLSLIALGAYLGIGGDGKPDAWKDIWLVTIGRILIAPVTIAMIIMIAAMAGLQISQMMRWVLYLIAAMPAAVTAPIFAHMFGHDRHLASRGVVLTSIISFLTAPLLVTLALKIEILIGLAEIVVVP